MSQIQTVGDTFMYSLQNFFAFLPTLLGAIILLIVGWFVAKLVGTLVSKGLRAVGFERAADRSGIGRFVSRSGSRRTTSDIVALLAKWFTFLIFVQGAANILAMPQLTTIINSIILFIPSLIVAVAIIVIASVAAEFLAGLVRASLSESGFGNPELMAAITKYAVLGFGIIAAINQVGIATIVVNTLLIGFVASIALAVGLAFGLGGKDTAANITSSWYEKGRMASRRASEAAETGSHRVGPDEREVA
jgi:hypothetical protein